MTVYYCDHCEAEIMKLVGGARRSWQWTVGEHAEWMFCNIQCLAKWAVTR